MGKQAPQASPGRQVARWESSSSGVQQPGFTPWVRHSVTQRRPPGPELQLALGRAAIPPADLSWCVTWCVTWCERTGRQLSNSITRECAPATALGTAQSQARRDSPGPRSCWAPPGHQPGHTCLCAAGNSRPETLPHFLPPLPPGTRLPSAGRAMRAAPDTAPYCCVPRAWETRRSAGAQQITAW